MRAIVHIGTPKTGTTSLQAWLADNRDGLTATGVRYNATFGERHSQFPLVCRLMSEVEDWSYLVMDMPARVRRALDAVGEAEFRARTDARLDEEIAAHGDGCHSFVASAEGLWNALRSEEARERLRTYLERRFESVELVLYLRRQDEYLLSAYSQRHKAGLPRSFERHVEMFRERGVLDYSARVGDLCGSFGRTNVQVRLLEAATAEGGTVQGDFVRVLGMDEPPFPVPEERLNRSWTMDLIAFAQRLFRQEPFASRDRFETDWDDVRRALDECPAVGPEPQLSESDRLAILRPYEDGNRAVAEAFFPDRAGQLFRRPDGGGTSTVVDYDGGESFDRVAAHVIRNVRRESGYPDLMARVRVLEDQLRAERAESARVRSVNRMLAHQRKERR